MSHKLKLDLNSFESYESSVLKNLNSILLNHYDNLSDINLNKIKENQTHINKYCNFSELEPITDKDINILDDETIDISKAELAILNGEIFWEHTAAGEATRLGLGTKYLLNLSKFSIEEIIKHMQDEEINEIKKLKLNETEDEFKNKIIEIKNKISKENILKIIGKENIVSQNISLGNRHMLQLAFDVSKLAEKYNLSVKEILNKQKNLIILNEETSDEILKQFIEWNFFGFNPKNIYFMIQKKFHGIKLENGTLQFDKSTTKNKKLHNHGQMLMQKVHNEVIFNIDSKNYKNKTYLKSEQFCNLLEKHLNLLSYNIEDLNYLNSSIDYPSLSLALELADKGYGMIMEIVSNNPIKPQKGGACFFDKKLNKVVMIESNQLSQIQNKEIIHLNKNFNNYPNPSQIFKKIKENGLPLSFEIKTSFDETGNPTQHIYPCCVQGDSNFLTKTAFVMRKNLKSISSWKSPATTPAAIKAILQQDLQENFTNFIKDIKTKTLTNVSFDNGLGIDNSLKINNNKNSKHNNHDDKQNKKMENKKINELIFKEYDIRGIFKEDFSEDLVKKIGYYVGLEIKKIEDSVCIGFDCRTHSIECFKWLVSGLNKANLKVINLGEVPTPVTYFSGYHKDTQCTSNIMITASHNPKEYNGFKMTIDNKSFFGKDIKNLKDQVINSTIEIEDNYNCEKFDITTPYIKMIVDKFQNLKNYKKEFIIDCGNGMSGPTIKQICAKLNLNYKLMYEKPDGDFPNHPADPSVRENLDHLIDELNKDDCELGFAHDGDSDRVYACLKSGPINPDILGILIAKTLNNPKVIGEVKCSKVMYDTIDKLGSTIMTKTGHANIKKVIRENPDTNFAIELSGHIFFKDKYFGYDDAIYSTFRILELEANGMDFEKEIEKLPKVYSTNEEKVKVDESIKFDIVNKFIEKVKQNKQELNYTDLIEIDGLRINFENGWGLVRASNTSPVLVTRFEANTQEELENIKTKILNILNQII